MPPPADYDIEIQAGDTATITEQTGEFDIEITLSDQVVIPFDIADIITDEYIAARLPSFINEAAVTVITDQQVTDDSRLDTLEAGYDGNSHLLQARGQITTAWSSGNPVLHVRELGVETDTLKFKIGDGSTLWNDLAYAGGGTDIVIDNNDGTATAV